MSINYLFHVGRSALTAAEFGLQVSGNNIANGIFFQEDIVFNYNVKAGDKVTVTGAANAENNFVDRTITSVIKSFEIEPSLNQGSNKLPVFILWEGAEGFPTRKTI